MVECRTDNVNRSAPEMRVLFRKSQLGSSGTVARDFDHVGMIKAEPTAQGFTVLSAKLDYKPKNLVSPASLSAEQQDEVEAFTERYGKVLAHPFVTRELALGTHAVFYGLGMTPIKHPTDAPCC